MAVPIRPKDLPAAPAITANTDLVVDTGTGVYRATPVDIVNVGGGQTYTADLAALKSASVIAPKARFFDGSTWFWTLGDYSALVVSDPSNYVAANSVPANVGAWVRTSPRRSDLASTDGAAQIGLQQLGSGAVPRTAQEKLQERVSVKDFGAIGDGNTHPLSERFASLALAQAKYPFATSLSQSQDWAAAVAATLTGKSVYFPRSSGAYVINATTDFGAIRSSTGIQVPNVTWFGEGAINTRINFTGTGTMLIGGMNAPTSNGYEQTLSFSDMAVYGNGADGSGPAVTVGLVTGASNANAGTTGTQRFLFWEFQGPSEISRCDFRFWNSVIETKFGYNGSIRDNRFRSNNIAISMLGAVTSMTIDTNLIEKCAFGIYLYTASQIRIQNNVLQANYAGADLVSYNTTQLIKLSGNYYEASAKGVVIRADSGAQFTPTNWTFDGEKHLDMDIQILASNFTFRNCRINSFAMSDPVTFGISNIVVEDNTDDPALATPVLFTNFTGAGAKSIIKKNYERTATPVYGTSIPINAAAGDIQVITATDGVGFAIGTPTNPSALQKMRIVIRNTSGGTLGAVNWDAAFKLSAWTSPATGNQRSIMFQYDGTVWREIWRTSADIPN